MLPIPLCRIVPVCIVKSMRLDFGQECRHTWLTMPMVHSQHVRHTADIAIVHPDRWDWYVGLVFQQACIAAAHGRRALRQTGHCVGRYRLQSLTSSRGGSFGASGTRHTRVRSSGETPAVQSLPFGDCRMAVLWVSEGVYLCGLLPLVSHPVTALGIRPEIGTGGFLPPDHYWHLG
jgi:hypothetical protein